MTTDQRACVYMSRNFPQLARQAIDSGITGTNALSEALGINRVTFYRWCKRHPKFASAVSGATRAPRSEFEKRNLVGAVHIARDQLYMRHLREPQQWEVLMEIGVSDRQHRMYWNKYPEYRAAFTGLSWGKGQAATMRKVTRSAIDLGKISDKKPNPRLSLKERRAAWRPDWQKPQIPERVLEREVKKIAKRMLLYEKMVAAYAEMLSKLKEEYGSGSIATAV